MTYQGYAAALNVTTGSLIWQRKMSSFAGLTVDANNVYISTTKSHVVALDRLTGSTVWTQHALLGRKLTAPVIYNGAIVVCDGEGYVHFLSAQNGHFVARLYVDRRGVTAPAITAQGKLFVYGDSGRLSAYAGS